MPQEFENAVLIREALIDVAKSFTDARAEGFSGHVVADYLRNDAAGAVREALTAGNLLVKGSPGQSRWADVPWIAVFDPIVTTSATRGYYLVYLFSANMERIYLCLGQGTTAVRQEFGKATHDELDRRSALIRSRLADFPNRFSTGEIRLEGQSQLAQDYERADALHIAYDAKDLPDEETMRADLNNGVELYLKLTARGGIGTFEDEPEPSSDQEQPASITERRRYRYHRKIERNPSAGKAAKKVHGYICQACDFDFAETYGELGNKYIEAHHLTPLSKLPEGTTVELDPRTDFAVLCANCHRMIHRKGAPNTVDKLRRLINRESH